MIRRTKLHQLERVYAQIPKVNCKGLCARPYCGAIGLTVLEKERIEERIGKPMGRLGPDLTCPLLSAEGRCTVYDVRPFICRLWGAEETLRCPHGCVPENFRGLTHKAGLMLSDQVKAIGGEMVTNY